MSLLALAVLMICGTSWVEAFNNDPQSMFIGMFLIGVAVSMISIPVLPEMMLTIEEDRDFCMKYNPKNI